VLNSFLEAMGNRQPKAVVTDGDMSMRDAVKVVFPLFMTNWMLKISQCLS